MFKAITREISPAINNCELTHLQRTLIDLDLANLQHKQYEKCLVSLGCELYHLPAEEHLPDSVFVEDTAIVFDELAIITRPGALSRRQETLSIANALKTHRQLYYLQEPATIDGGDVLVVDKQIYIGISTRTNKEAFQQVSQILSPLGYSLTEVEVSNCLHLKSAVSLVSKNTLLLNPNWVDPQIFSKSKIITVDSSEPSAANGLLIGEQVIFPSNYPKTKSILLANHINVVAINISEIIKAEGAVTCCSLIFH